MSKKTFLEKRYEEIVPQLREKLGIEIDKRPWHPHVTIGRAKRYLKNGINQKGIKILSSTFPVKSIEIMESKLSREGASYSVVRSYKL